MVQSEDCYAEILEYHFGIAVRRTTTVTQVVLLETLWQQNSAEKFQ